MHVSHGFELVWYDTEGLIHQLVALVKAKRFPENDAFTSLTKICLVSLFMNSIGRPRDQWDGQDPWFGWLKRVGRNAKVRVHPQAPQGQRCHNCSLGRQDEMISLDSWPVIPDEEDESD